MQLDHRPNRYLLTNCRLCAVQRVKFLHNYGFRRRGGGAIVPEMGSRSSGRGEHESQNVNMKHEVEIGNCQLFVFVSVII